MKKPRTVLRTIVYIGLIVIGILVYAYGWQVTDINLEEPRKEQRQKLVGNALRGLLSPDLFERDKESHIAFAHFLIPCGDNSPGQPKAVEGQPYLMVTPDCGNIKDTITVEGFNFHPSSDGYVRWTAPGGAPRPVGRIRTDANGHFVTSQLRVPTVAESSEPQVIEVEVEWPVGMPRPSEALKVTVERMIETIFLALIATTLGIIIAVPISFISAHNLMRQVRTPLGGLLAALLPLPVGWIWGRQLFQPLNDVALTLGGQGWWGVPALAVIGAGAYLAITRYASLSRPISNAWLAGLARYLRMVLVAVLLLFVSGLVSGIGMQASSALSGVLGGILSNILGTLSELLGLTLPLFSGLAGVFILGSLAGTLLDALLEHVNNTFVQRGLGLLLGAVAGGLSVFLVYRGIYTFYSPGEQVPFIEYATAGGILLGGGLGLFLRADYSLPIGLIIYYIMRTILNALRSIDPLIMAIIFAIWVSIGPFAGVLALTLHSIAAMGKLYSEQVESIDPGPIEAITATGATRLQTIVYGVVPQIVPPYIAFTLYRWDINVRMSIIIGFVGGGGIGFILQQWINLLQYRQAGVAVLAIAIVVSVLDYASAQARERIT
jgi:phosphonate ABC transporter permease subunit PhnE